MKIAIPTSDKQRVSEHFGRAKFLSIYDTEKKSFEHIDNDANLNAAHGAGTQSAAALINAGVEAVISPNLGPKAFDTFKASNVSMYILEGFNGSIAEAIDLYNQGRLTKMEGSTK